jgi:cell division septum initiation protein DivIVA
MDYEDQDPFDVVMFGYKRPQVDEFLRIQAEQEQTYLSQGMRFADLERRLDAVLAENTELRGKVARLTEQLTGHRPVITASARVEAMLLLAEEEADAIRAEAAAYADDVRRRAREDANLAAAARRHGEALNLGRHAVAAPPEDTQEHMRLNGSPRSGEQADVAPRK